MFFDTALTAFLFDAQQNRTPTFDLRSLSCFELSKQLASHDWSFVRTIQWKDGLQRALFKDVIPHFPRLTSMELHGSSLTLADADAIGRHCPLLNRVTLIDAEGLGFDVIQRLIERIPRLLHWDSGASGSQGELVQILARHAPQLQSLGLCKFPVCTWDLEHMVRFRSLTSLDLSGITRVDDHWARMLAKALPGLKALSLDFCTSITATGLNILLGVMNNMTELNLTCTQATDALVSMIVSRSPHMRVLSLMCCSNVSEAAVDLVAARLTKLDRLAINVTDHNMNTIAANLKRLTLLAAGNSPQLTDDGIRALTRSLNTLDTLNLQACKGVTDYALDAIAEGRLAERLTCLWLIGTGVTGLPRELMESYDAKEILEYWRRRRQRSVAAGPVDPTTPQSLYAMRPLNSVDLSAPDVG